MRVRLQAVSTHSRLRTWTPRLIRALDRWLTRGTARYRRRASSRRRTARRAARTGARTCSRPIARASTVTGQKRSHDGEAGPPFSEVHSMRQLRTGFAIAGVLVAGAACSTEVGPVTAPSTVRHADEIVAAAAPVTADKGELILGGLANPRGLTFGPEGALYVAE